MARLGERLGRLSRGAVDVLYPAIPTIRGLALRSVIGQQKPSNCSNLETSASEMSRPGCNSHFCWERSARHTLWVKRLLSFFFELRHERVPSAVRLRLAVRSGGSDKECAGIARPAPRGIEESAVGGPRRRTNLGSLPRRYECSRIACPIRDWLTMLRGSWPWPTLIKNRGDTAG